jgi:hypothetical protein
MINFKIFVMTRGIKISAILLSAMLISECATDRIQVGRQEELTCKTPKTRYDFGKNKPVRALKTNKGKYTANVYSWAWNNSNNPHSYKNTTRKDKHPGMLSYGLRNTKDSQLLAHFSINDLISPEQLLTGSENKLNYNELRKLSDEVGTINGSKDIIVSPSQDDLQFRIYKDNESGNTYVVSQKEYISDVLPNDSPDAAGVSIMNKVKSEQSRQTPSRKNEVFILMMAILAGLIPFGAIKATPKLAANISFWAAMNPWTTRFLFAGVQIALATAGVMLGERLAENSIYFSDLSRDVLLGTFLTSSIFYPVKHTSIKFFKHSYLKQKGFDLALAISGFMLMVNAGNDPGMRASFTNLVSFKGHEQQTVNMLNDHSQASKQLVYCQSNKQVQDEQTVPQHKATSKGTKIIYTILVVLAALVLGMLLAAAACELSCNGLTGLAVLVGIGGVALVLGLTVWAIKSIWHPKQKKIKKPSQADSTPKESTIQI